MRINKYIAARLGISRRKADELLAKGRITVDGHVAPAGLDVSDEHIVLIDGRELPDTKQFEYLLVNKPVGYVCSRDGQGSPTIYDLLPHKYDHLKPVGRLDKDSSGLLLLTNDGQLHNQLTHPSYNKEKTYDVVLNKPLSAADLSLLTTQGVKLKDGLSKFAVNKLSSPSAYEIVLSEGRNRQIRRTFNALGYKVVSLNRTKFGDYRLNNISSGSFELA